MSDQLLTLGEAAERFRLSTAETFARFARRHAIPLVQIGRRVVRVRVEDLDRAIAQHLSSASEPKERAPSNSSPKT